MKADTVKSFDFVNIVTEFSGYVSSLDKTNISAGVLVSGSKNVYKKLSGTIAVREGQKRLGEANSAISAISSKFVWNTSWGASYVLVVADSKLYVVIDDVWYTLLSGLTATRYVFDKWWDNTEKKDRALFVNGSSNLYHWSGGFATVASATVNTITKTGSIPWKSAGFSDTTGEKTLVINGVTYTYTGGESTTTLTGVTPDPSAIAADSTALQSVLTEANKPAASFPADYLRVINNQVYVGSYTSRLTYISDDTDFKNYTVPTPRTQGDPELLTLDGVGRGIGVRQGKAHIGVGTSKWAVVSFADITVGAALTQKTTVDIKPVAIGQAPYAHEFIGNVGDSLVYLAQDQQVRSFGDFNNLFTPGFPSLSQAIATELTAEDFTGGSLSCVGEFVYVCAPTSGATYIYQVRYGVDKTGMVIAERLWHPPFIWNLTSVDEVNGVTVGFSNANPQIYQLWDTNQWYDDSPSDEQLPYDCVAAFGYRNTGLTERVSLNEFDKLYTEGYITDGTPLSLTINFEYEGSKNTITAPINSTTRPARKFGSADDASLGDASLGDESLGGSGDEDINTLKKFRCINSVSQTAVFEYQPILSSSAANSRWELLAISTNQRKSDTDTGNFLINKAPVT